MSTKFTLAQVIAHETRVASKSKPLPPLITAVSLLKENDARRKLLTPTGTPDARAKMAMAYFVECGLPEPTPEFRFCERKWRFDFAWVLQRLALEVQGSIFTQGRHTRGASLLKEWEKLNSAAIEGWRILYVQPSDLMKQSTAETIRKALHL